MILSERFYSKLENILIEGSIGRKPSPDWFMDSDVMIYELSMEVVDIFDGIKEATLETVSGLIQSSETTRKFVEILPGLYKGIMVNTTGDIYANKERFDLTVFYNPVPYKIKEDNTLSIAYIKKFICFLIERYNNTSLNNEVVKSKFIETEYKVPMDYLIKGMKDVNVVWGLKDQKFEINDDIMTFIRKDEVSMAIFKKLNDSIIDISWDFKRHEDGVKICIFSLINKNF